MNFIENETEQKLRGGYYTPLDLAEFICRWVEGCKPQRVLEPSCGDGVFIKALGSAVQGRTASVVAYELLEDEAAKARAEATRALSLITAVYSDDFLGLAITQMVEGGTRFDAVVGNPPFIRYQYLPADAQQKAESIFKLLHLPFTKHTNAWVPFVLASIALLAPGGRLGMVLPSEIIHVMHAQSLRTYLGQVCSRLLVIDPEELWFEGTLQGAVILFVEKKRRASDHGDGLGMAKVSGRRFLRDDPEAMFDDAPRINGKTVEGKWTRALLTADERDLLISLEGNEQVHRFVDVANVDVGIVTGANKFFLVDDATVEKYGLESFAHPMFGRSGHCPGVIYDAAQHAANAANGNPTNFIWLKDAVEHGSKKVLDYIRLGERQKLDSRFKCRVRKPWYTVPSVYATQIGMLKRAHDAPRLIANRLGAYTTDTSYRVESRTCGADKLVYCFLNPLTALSAELEGRHYGGGVLELVPSEIEKLLVPLPAGLRPALRALDTLVRGTDMAAVLELQGRAVLGGIGLPDGQQDQLLAAWRRLRNRRQRITEDDI
jgi:adenine-specific DNA-methyltransferase